MTRNDRGRRGRGKEKMKDLFYGVKLSLPDREMR